MPKKTFSIVMIVAMLIVALPVRAEDGQPPIQRLGTGIPTSIAASPDGKTLAVGSSIGVWLLDAATLQPSGFWDTGFWVYTIEYSVVYSRPWFLSRRCHDQSVGHENVDALADP